MIFSVQHAYDATVRCARKQKTETRAYVASVDVDVPTPSAEDAPIAIRYKSWSSDKKPIEMRWYDGRLWKPDARSFYSGKPEEHLTLDWLVEQCSDHSKHYGLGSSAYGRRGEAKGALEDDKEVRDVISTEREAGESGIRQAARNLVAIDGMLWREAREPVFSIGHTGGFFSRDNDTYISVEEWDDQRDASSRFRLDEPHRVAEAVGKGIKIPKVEILVAEAIRLNLDAKLLVGRATSFRYTMGEHLPQQSREYFDAFATLRAAASADENDPKAVRVLADAMQEACRVHRECVLSEDEYYRDKATYEEAALRRYREGRDDHELEGLALAP